MRGFASRVSVAQAQEWLSRVSDPLGVEAVPLTAAMGRVLAENIVAEVDVPTFRRAMMDGFALQARDTHGATPYNRLSLRVIGQAFPGRPFATQVGSGEAVEIMTGAPLPEGADAVLPAERTERSEADGTRVTAVDEVASWKHVGMPGEDIVAGSQILARGRRLRPQDVGILSSIGVAVVPVIRRPQVRLVVTGNELMQPGAKPSAACIVDANGPMLDGLVRRDGGVVTNFPENHVVPDDPDAIRAALMEPADVVLVSGGSSVGREDHAPVIVAECGELAIHGIAMRPSSPTGMGCVDGRVVFLLPGNPVSCLCAYDFFARRHIRMLGALGADWPYRERSCTLSRKLVSQVGRVDYARVAIVGESAEPIAISGASILSSTTRADGFVIISEESEGLPAGSQVSVFLYDQTYG